MSFRLPALLLTLATSSLFFATGVLHAQTPRETVKAEAAANRASAPKGELSTPNQDKGDGPRSESAPRKSRAMKKAEAASAAKAGTRPMDSSSRMEQDQGKPAKP